jgi:RNA polymerase sigma-70 factor (ECF subfamily)
MNEQERHDLFSQLIARHQSELYAYIFAIVRNWEDADDLFQSLCLVLWRKFEAFRPETSFFAWARQTARYEVLKLVTRRRLSQQVDETLLEELTETAADVPSNKLTALERCREKLGDADRELLELHYVEDLGSRQIAEQMQRSQASVCNSLNRIRCWLLQCVQKELAQQEHSGKEYP